MESKLAELYVTITVAAAIIVAVHNFGRRKEWDRLLTIIIIVSAVF